MLRRLLVAAVILGAATAGLGTAGAAPKPTTCVLSGTAHITPGLAVAARSFSYTFQGTFTSCRSSDSTLKSGTVTATGSGNGGCTKSNTTGTADITWNNWQTTSLSFKTTGAGALLVVQGTATGGEFAGKTAKAPLVFQATPTDCNTAAGVTDPSFSGPAELG